MDMGIETAFTPWASLFGGMLIGLSAVMVMGLFGRIAGISGIAQGAMGLPGAAKDRDWRWAFLAGLVVAPLGIVAFGGTVQQVVSDNFAGMALAGLLVGFGTALGSGCTSGHGVCGLARLSGRSFAAVAAFMATGFATVFVLRHILGGA